MKRCIMGYMKFPPFWYCLLSVYWDLNPRACARSYHSLADLALVNTTSMAIDGKIKTQKLGLFSLPSGKHQLLMEQYARKRRSR